LNLSVEAGEYLLWTTWLFPDSYGWFSEQFCLR